jgi:dTDP-glucose 4,6-dehydratase
VKGKSLLVIGGTGFFGKSFLDAFGRGLLAPWGITRLRVTARHPEALRPYPELLHPGVSVLQADIARCAELPEADYVIHAAASTDARRYLAAPQQESSNIVAGVENYTRLALQYHAQSRIVYASSGAIYGLQPPDCEFLHETQPLYDIAGLAPTKKDYAAAKRAAEACIAGLGARGARVAVARCFAFIGYHQPRDQHFAVGNFIEDGLCGRPVTVHARHAVYRSYMHADDLVRWLMEIAEHAAPDCPTYNVGSSEAISVAELARVVAARLGVPAMVPALDSPAVDRYIPSVEKARRELGLTLQYDFRGALDDVIERAAAARARDSAASAGMEPRVPAMPVATP